jgi:hypothetical protein
MVNRFINQLKHFTNYFGYKMVDTFHKSIYRTLTYSWYFGPKLYRVFAPESLVHYISLHFITFHYISIHFITFTFHYMFFLH